MDSNFVLRFLLSNAILAVFLGGMLLIKRALRRNLTTPGQYRISLVALITCAAPFLPIQYVGIEAILRWFKHLGAGTPGQAGTAGTAQAADIAARDGNWLQDFTVSLTPTPQSIFYTILGYVLIGGAVLMLGALLVNNWRLYQIKKTLGPIESKKTLRIFEQCKAEVSFRRMVRLGYSPLVKTPLTFGLLRPYVVMPSNISNGDAGEIRCAMLHELYHCKRCDMLVNYIVAILRIVYWFNPAVWFFLVNIKRELELDCDHSVLQLLGDDDGVVKYGETVLAYASERRHTNDLVLASELGGSFKQLKKRMGHIIEYEEDNKGKRRKSLLLLVLVLIYTLLCVPSFSALASDTDIFSLTDEQIAQGDYASLFDGYTGSFVLYDPQTGIYTVSDETEAAVRYSPNSTYKIFSALLALEDGRISPDDSAIPWNGETQPYDTWNSDQDLNTAMANSVSWYFQNLDAQAGLSRLQEFFSGIGYGNERVGNTDTFWADGTLRISAIEQVQMLERFRINSSGFREENAQAVRDAMFLEASGGIRLFGKTGTGSGSSQDALSSDGWYIGYIEDGEQVYYFATHIQGEGASGSIAAQIAISIFEREGLYRR